MHSYSLTETVQVAESVLNMLMLELLEINYVFTAILSLTVEVQRAKGPNLIQDRDPIFERGSTTTYSSFRKGTYSKPWSAEGATHVQIPK